MVPAYGVVLSLVQVDGKTVAADIRNTATGEVRRVPREEFPRWRGFLKNAVVVNGEYIRGKDCTLPVLNLAGTEIAVGSGVASPLVRHYTVMFEDVPVVTVDKVLDTVVVHEPSKLPFGLRNREPLRASAVLLWISERVENINRTYMNAVYVARCVGRDRDKVIRDSSGISFTDNFWIKTSDSVVGWAELCKLRDTNAALCRVALSGSLNTDKDLMAGFTSLFTVKGFFSKAILGGYMYKLRRDSILEIPASMIGMYLGIPVSECVLEGDVVRIKLFTNPNCSLVHGSELKLFYNTTDELYNIFLREGGRFIFQMQRMYIFNYIIGNPDLHDDNYGFLYDPRTFELKSLSPCFDHNVAFQEGFNGLSRTTMGGSGSLPLDDLAKMFIHGHPDIVQKLRAFDVGLVSCYLSRRQVSELQERIANVIQWFDDSET